MTPSKPSRRLRVLVGGVAALVAVFLAVLALLSLDGVATGLTRAVLDRVSPQGMTLRVERVPRLGLRGLSATGVEFHDDVRGIHLRADSLRAAYRPLSWRWGRLALSRVEVVGLELGVDAERIAAAESAPAPPDDPAGTPWILTLDDLVLRPGATPRPPASGATADSALPSPLLADGDSTFRIGAVGGSFQGLRITPELGADAWALALAFAPSGLPAGWGRLSARGRWLGSVLELDTLSLASPRSRVAGRIRLPLDSGWSRPGGLEWRLEATPLALGDLEGLIPVPGVLAGDSLTLTSWSEALGDSARVRLQASTTAGAVARADFRWGREGSRVGYRGEAEVADLELRRYLGDGVPLGSTSGTVLLDGGAEWRDGVLATVASSIGVRVSAPEGEASLDGRVARNPGPDGLPLDTLDLSLHRVRWGEQVEGSGTLRATHTPGRIAWRADLRPRDGGRLTGTGDLTELEAPGGPRWTGDVRLAEVVEPRSGSVVTGRLRGAGSGASLPATLDVALGPSELAGWSLDTARVTWTGDAATPSAGGRIRGRADGPFGGVGLEAGLAIREDGGRVVLETVELEAVGRPDPEEEEEEEATADASSAEEEQDAAAGWEAIRVSGRVEGTLEWDGPVAQAADPARWRGEIDAALRSTAGAGPLSTADSLEATIRLGAGAVDGVVQARLASGGRAEVRAAGALTAPLDIRITEGRFTDLDVSAFVPSAPETRLDGTLAGEVRGSAEGAPPTVTGRIELDPSTVREGRLDGLAGEFVVGPGLVRGDLFAELAGGEVRGRIDGPEGVGREGWSTAPWRVEADVALPALGAFFDLPDTALAVAGHIEAELDPTTGTRVDLGLLYARGWGARIDTALVRGRLTGSLLTVDTLVVRSNLGLLAGGGTLPRTVLGLPGSVPPAGTGGTPSGPSALALALTVPDSAAVLRLGETRVEVAGGRADFQADCPREECAITGQIDMQTVLLGRWSVLSLQAGVEGSVGPGRRYGPTRTGILVEGLRSPRLDARNATFQTHWNGTDLEVVGTALVDDRRAAVAELRIDPGARSLAFQRLDLRFDEDRWSLERPVTFRADSSGLSLDSLVIASPPQRLLARLGEEDGTRYLSFEADSLRLGAFTDLLGRPGLGGSASGRLRLRGEEATLVLVGELAADLTMEGLPSHRVEARAEARGGDFTGDLAVLDPQGEARITGHAEGRVPGVGDEQWAGTLAFDDVPLGWAGMYAPPEWVRDATGSIQGRLSVTGGPQGLEVSGPVSLTDGQVEVPRAAIVLRDLRAAASFEGRTLVLESVRADSRGRLTLEGSVTLPPDGAVPEVDLRIAANDFLASNTREVEAAFSGNVSVEGTLDVPRVAGQVQVLQATYRIPATLGRRVREVTLTEEDWAILQSRFGIAPPDADGGSTWLPRNATLDLEVRLGRDIWLRRDANPELALQFTGDLRVTKGSADEELQLQGSVESIPGRSYVEEFGRRFTLEDGSVSFRGPLDASRLDVTAQYEVPTSPDEDPVTIRLNVTGWLDGLELALSSEPSLSNADVVSYLATGRPASTAFSGDGSGSFGADILASRLSGSLEQFAQEEVGLDVLQIQQDGLHGTSLVAGKYVNPRLFLGFRQGVTFQADDGRSFTEGLTSQAEVEYAALNWLVINVQGGTSAIRFFLEGTYGW